jgi:hypothetical protein
MAKDAVFFQWQFSASIVISKNFLSLEILVDGIAVHEKFDQLISLSSCFMISFTAQIAKFVCIFWARCLACSLSEK